MPSRLFGSKAGVSPHLLAGGGLGKEIADLRNDVEETFVQLESGSGDVPLASIDQTSPPDDGGLGTYLRTVRRVASAGVLATDVARRDAALAAVGNVVSELHFLGGTALYDTAGVIKSGTILSMAPSYALLSSIVANGDPKRAAWLATLGATLSATTLQAGAAKGATSFHSVASIPAGSIVRINSTGTLFHCATRKTGTPSGSAGNYTIPIDDEPLNEAFLTGDAVSVLASVPHDIYIFCNGALFSGTGERAIELEGVWDFVIDGANVAGSFVANIIAADVGNRRGVISRNRIDGGGAGTVLLAIETGEHVKSVDNRLRNAPAGDGVAIWDSYDCGSVRDQVTGCVVGISISADANTTGCNACYIEDPASNVNGIGIYVQGGSSNTKVRGGNTNDCTSYGVAIASDGSTCANTKVTDHDARRGGTYGILNSANATGTHLKGVDVTGCASSGLLSIGAGLKVEGLTSASKPGTGSTIKISGGDAAMSHVEYSQTTAGSLSTEVTAGSLILRDSKITTDGASYGLVVRAGASAQVYGSKFVGCTIGLYAEGAITVDSVDLSGCATPVTISGAGTVRGSFSGAGSPETAVVASVGSTYRRTDGGAATSFYVKESGNGNTGWVGK